MTTRCTVVAVSGEGLLLEDLSRLVEQAHGLGMPSNATISLEVNPHPMVTVAADVDELA